MTDLYIKGKIIKVLKENVGSKLFNIGISSIFLYQSPPGKENTSKNKQMRLHQTKKLLQSEGNH